MGHISAAGPTTVLTLSRPGLETTAFGRADRQSDIPARPARASGPHWSLEALHALGAHIKREHHALRERSPDNPRVRSSLAIRALGDGAP
jgi:hypothetical protein